MKRINILLTFAFTCCAIFPSPKIDDKYIGNTIDQVIKEIGLPDEMVEKKIDKNYLGYENEPNYSNYFSAEELENGVLIKIVNWNKKKEKISLWLKKENEVWVVFSSVQYSSSSAF